MGVKSLSRAADCCMDSKCVEMTIGTPPPIPPAGQAGPPAPHAPLLQPKAYTSLMCRSCACCMEHLHRCLRLIMYSVLTLVLRTDAGFSRFKRRSRFRFPIGTAR